MSLAIFILLLVALTTFFNAGLQYYTTVSTYPLFSEVDEANFVRFHKAYEGKLPLSIYIPYSLWMLSTLALLFVRPDGVTLLWVVLLLVLNGSIMAVSLAFAAPVHTKLDREGKNAGDLAKLRRYNLPRLLAVAASSMVALYLLTISLTS